MLVVPAGQKGQGTWRSVGRWSETVVARRPDMAGDAALATATGSARYEYDPSGDLAVAKLVEGFVYLGQWLGGRLTMNFARGC